MGDCRPTRDFVRHIFNIVVAESSEALPLKTIEMLKERMARAEDKYKFSIYGGNPAKLIDFFSSEDWVDIVKMARGSRALAILERSLNRLIESYKDSCPDVAAKASEAIASLGKEAERPRETLQTVVAKLQMQGFKVEIVSEGEKEYALVKEPLARAEIRVGEEGLSFVYHKEGKAESAEELIAFLKKMREI